MIVPKNKIEPCPIQTHYNLEFHILLINALWLCLVSRNRCIDSMIWVIISGRDLPMESFPFIELCTNLRA